MSFPGSGAFIADMSVFKHLCGTKSQRTGGAFYAWRWESFPGPGAFIADMSLEQLCRLERHRTGGTWYACRRSC